MTLLPISRLPQCNITANSVPYTISAINGKPVRVVVGGTDTLDESNLVLIADDGKMIYCQTALNSDSKHPSLEVRGNLLKVARDKNSKLEDVFKGNAPDVILNCAGSYTSYSSCADAIKPIIHAESKIIYLNKALLNAGEEVLTDSWLNEQHDGAYRHRYDWTVVK